jgi:hypothetical protein
VLELPPPREAQRGTRGEVPRSVVGRIWPARAFVIKSGDQLLQGATADGQIGDYELENGKLAFVIARPDHFLGFADSGGHLIDAGPAAGHDALKQIVNLSGGQRQAIYETVETEQRDGAALVRARGHDSADANLGVITEYRLGAGALALEITTTYHNRGSSALRSFSVGDAIQWGRAERFIPEEGFTLEAAAPRTLTTPEGWLIGVAPKVSYAYVVEGPLKARHGVGWSDVTLAENALMPGAEARVKRWLVVSATPDVALGETLASLRQEEWPRITGRVVDNTGPVAGARLIFSNRSGRPITLAESQLQGNYAQVAPADDYLVSTEAIGRSGSQRLEVTLAAGAPTTLDVLMSPPGSLRFTVEENGHPVPAKLSFFGIAPTLTPLLGPANHSPGANVVLTAGGSGQVPLAPGRYHLVASRGPAFTLDEKDVEVTAGEPAEVHFRVSRAIDLAGLACADLHQHAAPSADSGVSPVDRVASNLAEGLDIEVATDHNTLSGEYAAALEQLHAAAPLAVAAGVEITREGVGHFNVWPLAVDSSQPQGGAPDLRGQEARSIFSRTRAPDRVLSVNHPREGGIGYFNLVGYKADAPLPPGWDGGFDAIEVVNGKDASQSDEPLADWMSLTNRGLVYTGVGGSDSHLIWGQEVGYPRTCVFLDGPPSVQGLVSAIREKRAALVTNGPFVTVSIGGKGMGQLAPAPRGKVRLDVEVRAAPWVDTRKLEIFVNGERRGKAIEIPPSKNLLRYQGSHELKIDHDAAVVVIVRGETSLEPVVSRPEGAPPPTPLAVTNPIFVDRDGDGHFTGPITGPGRRH